MQIKTKIVSFHAADSKPVKLEVNSKVVLPPLDFLDIIDFGVAVYTHTEREREQPYSARALHGTLKGEVSLYC